MHTAMKVRMKTAILIIFFIKAALSATDSPICDLCECSYSNLTSENKTINVNCYNKNLAASEYITLPGKIGDLDLSHNQLTSARIGNADRTITIQSLHLNRNRIETVVGPDFYRIANVEILDLSFNRITELIGQPFLYLKNLQKLDLSGNVLREIPENSFKNLKDLQELRLDYNPLHYLGPSIISGAQSLQHLSLSSTALDKIHPDAFKRCDSLQYLDLSFNNLDLVPTNSLENADQLRHFKLNGNPIEIIEQRSFWFPTSLEEIELDEMPSLRQVEAQSFSRLKSLYRVSISNNKKLKQLDAKAFEGANALQEVDLSRNQLTAIENGDDLVGLCHDSKFNFSENQWHCDCSLKWMLKCLSDKNISAPICSSPDSKEGFQISILTDDELVCDDGVWVWGFVHVDKQVGIVLIVFGVLGVLASLCGILLMSKYRPKISWNRRVKDKNEDVYYVRMEDPTTKTLKENRDNGNRLTFKSSSQDDVVLFSK